MSNLRDTIKNIQRAVGCAEVDGVFGPATAARVWAAVNRNAEGAENAEEDAEKVDARSLKNLSSLDAKAVPCFAEFYRLANATAATLGCDYIIIGGNRSWAEQDALYALGRTQPGSRVTKARGGQSNHNFGIAADFGVFVGKTYLDGGTPEQAARAAKVHRACSVHAAACGLEWGGSWKSFADQPHYEVETGLSMMQKRAKFKAEGSVL